MVYGLKQVSKSHYRIVIKGLNVCVFETVSPKGVGWWLEVTQFCRTLSPWSSGRHLIPAEHTVGAALQAKPCKPWLPAAPDVRSCGTQKEGELCLAGRKMDELMAGACWGSRQRGLRGSKAAAAFPAGQTTPAFKSLEAGFYRNMNFTLFLQRN